MFNLYDAFGSLSEKTYKPAPKENKIVATSGKNFSTYYNTKRSGGKTRGGLSQYQKNLVLDHYALRQNTRAALAESTQARTLLERFNDSVIGNGLKLEPTPAFEILGISREEAEKWSENVKERFDMWAKSKDSDLTGRNNFYQNQRLCGFFQQRDNDVFPRITYSDDPELLNPVQISFIDPNQVRGDEFTFSAGPETQANGIKNDKNGKEESYIVWINDPEKIGRFKFVEIPARDKNGRPLMMHVFNPEYAGQSRGYSRIAHALQDFEDITTYSTATTRKAINGASMNFAVENMQQDPSDMGLESLVTSNAGLTVVTDETGTQPSAPVNLGIGGVDSCTLPEATFTEVGVNLLSASQGDKLVPIDSNAPSENFGGFVDSQFTYLSASISMPMEVALMKFTNSFAASKGALGLFWKIVEIWRDEIASDFLNFVYFAWLSEEIASGTIKAPGFSDPKLRAAWLQNTWFGHAPPDLQPVQTLTAIKMAADMGLTNLDREAKNYNNSNGKANRSKLTKEIEELPTDPFGVKESEQEEIDKIVEETEKEEE